MNIKTQVWVVLGLMMTLACNSEPAKMTPKDKLEACKSICGKRPITDFEVRMDDGYECRCAEKPQCEPDCARDGGAE